MICSSNSFKTLILSLNAISLCFTYNTSCSGLSGVAFAIASTIFATSVLADALWPPLTRFFFVSSSILVVFKPHTNLSSPGASANSIVLCSQPRKPHKSVSIGPLCCRTCQGLHHTGLLVHKSTLKGLYSIHFISF